MNVQALIAYLAAWLKELIKGIMQTFDWLQALGEKLGGTAAE